MADTPKKDSKRKKILVWVGSIAGVAVLALGAGLLIKLLQQQAAENQAESFAKKLDSAQTLTANGNYDAAQQTLSNELQRSDLTDQERFNLLYMQGTVSENKGDNQAALKSYQAAAAIKDTQGIEESIGRVAEKVVNKELAINSYKKAIQLIPADKPTGEADKERYQNMIRNLGGQP